MLAWLVTGVITLLGALAYGELAAMYPRAGGQYVFLRESMGPLMGFLYGWTLFVVIQTGTIAAVAVAFGRFLGVLVPGDHARSLRMVSAARTCVSRARLHGSGERDPARTHAAAARRAPQIWRADVDQPARRARRKARSDDAHDREDRRARAAHHPRPHDRPERDGDRGEFRRRPFSGAVDVTVAFVIAFGAALVGSLFSSDAWNNVTFAAAEVKNPAAKSAAGAACSARGS